MTSDDVTKYASDAMMSLLPELIRKLISEPECLQRQAQDAIERRLEALNKAPASREVDDPALPWTSGSQNVEQEIVRLRCLLGMLPTLSQAGPLNYVLGMVKIDGRPGDYVKPRTHQVPPQTEDERVEQDVELSIAAADSMVDEVAVLWVARPAVEAVRRALYARRRRNVAVMQQPDHVVGNKNPWDIKDILMVSPEKPSADE